MCGVATVKVSARMSTSPAITAHSQGLHGYIAYGHEDIPPQSAFTAGAGFYSAVWPLTDMPLAGFQIGLPGTWILPDNSDDKDTPLAPEGTLPADGESTTAVAVADFDGDGRTDLFVGGRVVSCF